MSTGRPGDDDLRRAWASLPAAAAPGCPPPEAVLRCAWGEAPGAEVEALAEHLVTCGRCAQAWRLAAALREPEAVAQVLPLPAPEPVAQVLPLRPRRRAAWVAGLSAAAVVAGVLVLRPQGPHDSPDTFRGEASSALTALVTEAPASACTLRWSALPGATYEVAVTRASGGLLFRAERLRDTTALVPAAALQGTAAGEQVFWRVVARLDDGRTVTSPTFPLTLR